MDVLLRRHARRSASGLSAESARPEATHMDADELSAYAEGALPEAARTRYMLHLADCDSCRRIVTELALSSSIEAEERGTVTQTVEPPSRSWLAWLAALFSPPVLRYAAPVLALLAFGSIIFVVVTRNRDIASEAQRQVTTEQAQNTDTKEQNEPASTTGTSSSTNANQQATPGASANNAGPNAATPGTQLARESVPANNTPGETDVYRSGDAPKPSDTGQTAQPPPAPAQETVTEAKQAEPQAQPATPIDKAAEFGKGKDNPGFVNQNRRERNDVTMGGAPSTSAGAAAGSGRRAQPETAKSSPRLGATTDDSSNEDRQKKREALRDGPASTTTTARPRRGAADADEESSATRTVAGKRFRQQNGIWVDNAYSSSRSTIRVRRGSEQYRALVADEPIVGAVANSISGQVIVVAGGRAYHIY
ncbi:MAG TPA: zf-HC2 domain-containing protein [Pyrinomonadaceae bacterium]|nr:zf-HC2 domain-containing protein [Pyrinomonadaceae bacterium]